ncbi:MAG: hypothetical protein MZU95_12035 [Desulfomicrobium escambiense]|nr:hypothetical protein [Desulfomicrobium escambiense]
MKILIGRSASLLLLLMMLVTGCSHFGHYPVNAPLERSTSPATATMPRTWERRENSEELLLILSFSGGGTRAAAFSYGVLEELRATEVAFDGREAPARGRGGHDLGRFGGKFHGGLLTGSSASRIFEDYEGTLPEEECPGGPS